MLDPTPKDSATPPQPKPSPNPRATILVCYHKFSKPIIASEILRPIIVGAANMGEEAKILQEKLESKLPKNLRLGGGQQIALDSSGDSMDCRALPCKARNDSSFSHCERSEAIHDSSPKAQSPVLRDDDGENISHLNANFCELTAMYWAWKNVDSSYYGLFHYRRILDLSEQALKAKPQPIPITLKATQYNANDLGLSTPRIQELLAHYDIILPQAYVDHKDDLDFSDMNVYDIYAKYHYASDLDAAIDIILERYPQMRAALESALFTKPPKWHIANVFIMRKDLYDEYCQWLFDILFSLQNKLDISSYNPYQARIYGFISERLLNVWLAYKKQTSSPKILEAPLVLLHSEKPLIGWDTNSLYKRFYFFGLRVYKAPIKPKS